MTMELDLSNGLIVAADRHPATRQMALHFTYSQLPPRLQKVSAKFAELGQFLVDNMYDNPELTETLRKLWEAKNCAVLSAGFLDNWV